MAGRAGKKEVGKSKKKPAVKKGVERAKREKRVDVQTRIALEKYRVLFESFPLGISITDKAGNLIEANKESERLLGITRDAQTQRRYDGPEWKIIRPDGTPMPPDEYASVRALKENRRIENVEMGIVKSKNEVTWINVTAEPIPLEDFGVAITYSDISTRRMLEKDLEKQRREFKHIIDSAPIIIFYKDLSGRMIRVNKTFSEALKLSEDEILGKTVFDVYSAPIAQAMTDDDQEVIRTGRPKLNIEEPYESASGIRWVQTDKVPIIDDNGLTIGLVGFAQDITERKLAELALKESEEKFRSLFDRAPVGIALTTIDGYVIELNNSQAKMMGYTAEELRGKKAVDFYINPDRRAVVEESVQREGKLYDFEVKLRRKDGSVLIEMLNFDQLQIAGSNFLLVTGRDITGLREAEKARRESEAQYQLLAEHTTDFVWLMDMNLNLSYQSPSAERLTGFTHEELASLPFEKRLTSDSLHLAAEAFLTEMPLVEANPDYNPVLTLELEVYRKDGSTLWSENKLSIIRDVDARPVSILGEARDITRRKQAEEALRQSEVKYSTVLEQIEEAYYELDLAGNLTFFNDATCRQLGYSYEELIGMNYRAYISKEDVQRIYEIFNQVYRTGKPNTDFPVCEIRKDGSLIFTENSAIPLLDENHEIIGFRGVARDVTQRKRAEEAIRKSEAQYRLLAEHTTDTVWLMDMHLKTIYQSPSAEKLRGYTPEEILTLPLEKHLTPGSFKLVSELLPREIPRVQDDPNYNPVHTLNLEYYCKDGTTVWTENTFSVIRDPSGKAISILAEARDITKRREAEKKLELTLAALEKTLRDTVIAISKMVEMKDPFTAGHQIRVAQLATAIAKKMNLEDEQIAILNTASTIHDIGKIYVPSDILSKPGKLNPLEYEIIQTHVRGSYEILKEIDFAGPIAEIVFQHHERMDGSGYPRALKRDDILLEAKILIVADVVEAMSSHRPYRAAMGIDKALEEININSGKLYDEAAVDACLDVFNNDRFWFSPVESTRIV